jgi:porin-like protein
MTCRDAHIHTHAGAGASLAALWLVGLSAALSPPAHSQIVLQSDRAQLTVEGFANLTLASVDTADDLQNPDYGRIDGGLRVLGRTSLGAGPTLGIRLAVEGSDENARLTEASILLFDDHGRIEIGQRMGLPDVLTGYAPNNFQFTSAEFGPASGPSLDPGGGLQTGFLRGTLAQQIGPLVGLGATAALFDDRSAKVLYVSPKTNGWLAGASFARDADDAAVEQLLQAGITHESYSRQDTLRWGATYARGRAAGAPIANRDVNSFGVGASVTLHEVWMIGLAASYDGASRLPENAGGSFASPAWGATASVNFNTGPWTIGGYCQYASSEGDTALAANDRLVATQIGASYRFTTRLRVYAAWYRFDFDDDERNASTVGNVFLLGARATL